MFIKRWSPRAFTGEAIDERTLLTLFEAARWVLVSKTTHLRGGDTAASPLRNHSFDAGAAWAHLALQALHSGWHAHAIGRQAEREQPTHRHPLERFVAEGRFAFAE
jgi:hypothetical protein